MSNTQIEIIFLDIDGVVADFDTHLHTQNKTKPNGKIDHDALDYAWWSTIPIYEGARSFYDELTALNEVKFLTGPMVSVDCFAGKAAWISEKFLPDRGKWALTDLIICHSKRKNLMAAPNRILIDDRIENVESWRQAGGIGIHHQGDFTQTLAQVKRHTRAEPTAVPVKSSVKKTSPPPKP